MIARLLSMYYHRPLKTWSRWGLIMFIFIWSWFIHSCLVLNHCLNVKVGRSRKSLGTQPLDFANETAWFNSHIEGEDQRGIWLSLEVSRLCSSIDECLTGRKTKTTAARRFLLMFLYCLLAHRAFKFIPNHLHRLHCLLSDQSLPNDGDAAFEWLFNWQDGLGQNRAEDNSPRAAWRERKGDGRRIMGSPFWGFGRILHGSQGLTDPWSASISRQRLQNSWLGGCLL